VKRCLVNIDTSANTVLSRTVNDYEVPVLGALFGHGNVTVIDESDAEPIGAEEAMFAMISRYRSESLVRSVYRDVRDLSNKAGLKLTGEVQAERRSLQSVGGTDLDKTRSKKAA
jgi:hypothetical protein